MPARRTPTSVRASRTAITENRLPRLELPSPSTIPVLLDSFLHPSRFVEKDGHIKRPSNAFLLFRSHVNEDLKQKRITILPQNQHSAQVAALWRTLTPKEKQPYEALSKRVQAVHENAFPEYEYRPQGPKAPSKRARKAAASSPPSTSASPVPLSSSSSPSSSSLSSPSSSLSSPPSSLSSPSSSLSSASPSSSEGLATPLLFTSPTTFFGAAAFRHSPSPFLLPIDEGFTNDMDNISFSDNTNFPPIAMQLPFPQPLFEQGSLFPVDTVQQPIYSQNHLYHYDSFRYDAYCAETLASQHPMAPLFPIDGADAHLAGESYTGDSDWESLIRQYTCLDEGVNISIDPSLLQS